MFRSLFRKFIVKKVWLNLVWICYPLSFQSLFNLPAVMKFVNLFKSILSIKKSFEKLTSLISHKVLSKSIGKCSEREFLIDKTFYWDFKEEEKPEVIYIKKNIFILFYST